MNASPGQAQPTTKEKIVTEHSKWLMYADYDPKSLRLEVGFKDGRIVQHWPVYPQTWIDFKASPSKGSFYSSAIKKVTPPIEIKK